MPNFDIMKKYVILISLLITVLISPILVNWFLLRPAIGVVVGKDTDWLVFWGNYLGGVVSVLGAFVILYVQRHDNNCQNQANREANKEENKRNRELQLNILRQQQENIWLDKFRQVGFDYVRSFYINDLTEVANAMSDPILARDLLRKIVEKVTWGDTQISYYIKKDDRSKTLSKDLAGYYKAYKQAITDIQLLVIYLLNNPSLNSSNLYEETICLEVSESMHKILGEYKNVDQKLDIRTIIAEIIVERTKDVKCVMTSIRELIFDYIKEEQYRINEIVRM